MWTIPSFLEAAARHGREELESAARRTALASTGSSGEASERALAHSARQVLFTEALLGALRARFAELRTVSK